MRWEDLRRSQNVEDQRGDSQPSGLGGGIRLGFGGIVIVGLLSLLLGQNPIDVLSALQGVNTAPPAQVQVQQPAANDQNTEFVRAILGDTEDTWQQIFQASGEQYQKPRLVLFNNAVNSACGYANAAVGPFYCPGDQKVYLDLSFFQELSQRFGASGDFARAYVIAHEIGHHVQNLMGISDQVSQQQRRVDEVNANALSVRLELQADCFAGVWGHYADRRNLLEQGDVEEALRAATEIGDDRLQKRSQGYVVPESFTHGSSAQRVQWFQTGLEGGDIRQCNTFANRRI
jgi:uncharacterized protein